MDIESGEVDIESTKVDIERVLMPFAKMPKTNRRTVKAVKNDTARGDLCVATKTNYVEILNFRHFFKHIVFTSEGDKTQNKEIKNYINVSVVVDIECGNTNN